MKDCPFCHLPAGAIVAENSLALAFRDLYPVSEGHTLIVPKRHVADYFDLTPAEIAAMHELLQPVKASLDALYRPDGYNLGVNVGPAAGQTVFHVHLHVIPRYAGDLPDPRGGVRGVIPGKRGY